ncbi:MAG: tyrosine-type recombinase/integrase [Chitinophagaceae bacterium]|nr:tyrosine-type recombinase/integrase [Chitinophagaceae bacterium]
MKLYQLVTQYVHYRKSLGEKFKSNETCLKAFCSAVGPEKAIGSVTEKMVHRFLYGKSNTVTTGWFVKHTVLLGLYRYAITRNYVTRMPLPKTLPKRPQGLVPYIYSQQELKLLFDGAMTYQKLKSHIEPYMVQTSLVLMYTLGLRVNEALSITLGDIDMNNLVVTIQQSKFYKSRLVPFNQQVKELLKKFHQWRKEHQQSQQVNAYLFLNQHGEPFYADTLRGIFERIRKNAGIRREDRAHFQPRLHDLRHTFVVNVLLNWYRENKDVQQLLPILSVYMGHSQLAHTSVYLSMTSDLLQEASARFEEYTKTQKS